MPVVLFALFLPPVEQFCLAKEAVAKQSKDKNTSMRKTKIETFLRETILHANVLSRDESTKVGATFMDPDSFAEVTFGYNGIPRGIQELPERKERPLKYSFFEHAERNAIYNLARTKLEGSVALSTAPLTVGCTRALVSVGAKEVWLPHSEQQASLDTVCEALLREGGISVIRYNPENLSLSAIYEQAIKAGCTVTMKHVDKVIPYLKVLAELPALLSKDPYAQATMFLHPTTYTRLARGYSGMPRGADDSVVQRYEAPLRELWVEGSLRNAIYNLVRPELEGTIGLITATTCGECARAVAAVGVSKVYYQEPTEDFVSRWAESIGTALKILDELGVSHEAIPRDRLQN